MSGEGAGSAILKRLDAIDKKLDRLLRATGAGGEAADDRDLDGQYGDEQIRKSPPRWDGPDMSGRRMSETSAEFLDCFSEFKDWQAARDDEKATDPTLTEEERAKKKKYAGYDRKTAARARGWAARLRNGWKPPASTLPAKDPSEEWT